MRFKDMYKNIDKIISDGKKISEKIKQLSIIKQTLLDFYELKSEDYIFLKTRRRKYLNVRHNSMYLMYKTLKMPIVEISNVFKCNHATVIHAVKKIDDYITWDNQLKKEITELDNALKLNLLSNNSSNYDEKFYFIDLNNFISLKNDNGQAIIFCGFKKDNVKDIVFLKKNIFDSFKQEQITEHNSTGLYIIENKDENKDKER